jgi:hypothetical protein
VTAPAPDLTAIVRRIGSIFERAYATGASKPTWVEVEQLLGDGYAQTLRMESERTQIERLVSRLVAGPVEGDIAHELRALSARHGEVDRNARWLRSLLGELHEYGLVLQGDAQANGRAGQEPAERLDG